MSMMQRPGLASSNLDDLDCEVWDDIEACADLWQRFEADATRTVFQRHAWIAAWARAFLEADGVEPRIIVGRSGGEVRIILPLGIERRYGGVRRLTWLAHAWSDYSAPLVAPDLFDAITPARIGRFWYRMGTMVGADGR